MTEPPEGLRPQGRHPKATTEATSTPSSTLVRRGNMDHTSGAGSGTRKRPGREAGALCTDRCVGQTLAVTAVLRRRLTKIAIPPAASRPNARRTSGIVLFEPVRASGSLPAGGFGVGVTAVDRMVTVAT